MNPPCDCCKKPAKKLFFIFEPGVTYLDSRGEDIGGLEFTTCTRTCAREIAYGSQTQCPKLPKGVKIVELDEKP